MTLFKQRCSVISLLPSHLSLSLFSCQIYFRPDLMWLICHYTLPRCQTRLHAAEDCNRHTLWSTLSYPETSIRPISLHWNLNSHNHGSDERGRKHWGFGQKKGVSVQKKIFKHFQYCQRRFLSHFIHQAETEHRVAEWPKQCVK